MKAKKILISAILVGAIGLVGCSSSEKIKDVPVATIQQSVVEKEGLLSVAQQPVDAKEHWVFEEVADKIEEGFVSQALINVKLQDVFVVKTTDAQAVKTAIQNYKDNSLRMFGDGYGGEENIQAVANSILAEKGNYVYFIATPNASDVEKEILNVIS